MIPVYVYYSSWVPGPKDTRLPLFKQEEGTPFSVTYGYESWPTCMGPTTRCLKLSMQAWLSTNSLNSNYVKVQLHLLCGLSFAYNNSEPDVKSLSRVRLFVTPVDCRLPGSSSTGFSRQGYCSGLPFPSPRIFPDPGIEPGSPALQADALPSEPLGNPMMTPNWTDLYASITSCGLKSKIVFSGVIAAGLRE